MENDMKIEFLNMPNLPDRPVSMVLLDFRTDKKIVGELHNLGIEALFTYCNINLPDSICGHPDMFFHHLGNNNFVCSYDSYDFFSKLFSNININLIRGKTMLSSTYPQDIAYNVSAINHTIFCTFKYADKTILDWYALKGFSKANVSQGYAKCNICVINKNAIITSDTSISKKAVELGFDVLTIQPGHITLKGHDYGFIGGATGLIDKNILAVTGNLNTHPDYHAIEKFCDNHNVRLYSLTDEKPVDIGSIIPISYKAENIS